MNSPLIATKLLVPTPRQGLVSRPTLLDRVGEGLANKFTLISSASGYGKTTLLAEWCEKRGGTLPMAWVSLDEGDNDPVLFLSYLIAALQNVQDGFGQDSSAMMQGAQNPLDTTIISFLINELSEIAQDFVLVLEDYHVIELRDIHQMMVFLLERLPPQMHMVILTRADPPFPLARMRARGELLEVRAKDLRFSHSEVAALLQDMVGLHFSENDVQTLLNRTEGWVTGLQLAALSLQGRENPSELITYFGSGNDYIVDYLIEEVLELQPENLKMFLLQTSILGRLNGSLCNAVTGQPDGEATLEHLEKANLFVTSLGGEQRWYRYHHLFADVMSNRLQRFFPNQVPEFHSRAAKWFKENNLFSEAVEHALAANDYITAAEIVEIQTTELLKTGGLSTLLGWLKRFPPEVVDARPRLKIGAAWVALLTGKLDNIENFLATAETHLDGLDNINDLRGQIAAIRAYAAAQMGQLDRAIEQAQSAFELLLKDNLAVRCVVAFVMGGVYYSQRDTEKALASMQEASDLGEQAGNIYLAVSALNAVADLHRLQGNLTESEKVYYRAMQLGTGRNGQPLPITSSVHVSLAELRLAENDLIAARQFALTGLEMAEKIVHVEGQFVCHLVLAQIEHLERKPDKARAALEKAKKIAATHQIPQSGEERIIACEKAISAVPVRDGNQGMLIDPLSEREMEVLQLFADGLSNQEVAERLIISLGTVKAHSSNIYRKLDVRNRTQAVIAAREMNIL